MTALNHPLSSLCAPSAPPAPLASHKDISQFWEGAEQQNGPTTRLLCELGREHRVHVGASILEARGEHFYNVFVLAGPNGEVLGEVFKQEACALECLYFKGASSGKGIDCPALGIRVGVSICYDNQVLAPPWCCCFIILCGVMWSIERLLCP